MPGSQQGKSPEMRTGKVLSTHHFLAVHARQHRQHSSYCPGRRVTVCSDTIFVYFCSVKKWTKRKKMLEMTAICGSHLDDGGSFGMFWVSSVDS